MNRIHTAWMRVGCQDPETEDGHNDIDNPDLPPIGQLPIVASNYFKDYNTKPFGWTVKLKVLLEGIMDASSTNKSPLHKLRGFEDTIVRKIYSYFASEYVPHVKLTLPAKFAGRLRDDELVRWNERSEYGGGLAEGDDLTTDFVSFTSCGNITFPPFEGRNVNMMPFILGSKESLPSSLRCYHDCISQCPIDPSEEGKVCYLTVHETYVEPNTAQRREGLHIEAPGLSFSSSFMPGVEHHWGGGHFYSDDSYEGGIYFASSVANTSVVYNALIDKNIPGIVDKHGNCEHLRRCIGPGTKLKAGQLVWITDRTPHEAVPQEEGGYRQFFRVVTSNISHWYAQHSTANPKVKLPSNIIVVEENKFL